MRFHIAIILIVLSVTSVYTQTTARTKKPVIFIQNFENRGKGFDIIGDVMKYSLRTILSLTGKYRIVTTDTLDTYLKEMQITNLQKNLYTKEDFLKYRESLLFSEVMLGSFMPILNGKQVLWEVHVFRMIDGEDSFLQAYQSTTDAEIFDVIDGIGQDLSRILTGKTLAISRLDVSTLVPNSIIYIDGIAAGTNSVQYNRAISGLPHKVEIRDLDDNILFEKKVIPQEGLIYDINYNFKEYEKLVEKEVFVPSTNIIDQTNQILIYRTNELKIVSTNFITEKVSKKSTSEPQLITRYKKFGWSLSGGGGTMSALGLYYSYEGLMLELNAGFIPLFLGYTTDNYISANFLVSIFPFSQLSMFSPYFKIGIMSYYGLNLGLIPTIAHEYSSVGFQMHFRKLPGFLGKIKWYVEAAWVGHAFYYPPNTQNIDGLFNKPVLAFGIRL